ncbi:MAG: toxin-antitoxin system HicB family antitoxin [Bacteroidota bacterium]|nr:toxin-antitoxin system HicB family antitoxin [Bacteroidota bacterium]
MKKDLNYYMNLNYPIEVVKIPKDEGGGFAATIPQLGRNAFVGDGETIDEAIKNLEQIKLELFEDYLKKGIPIPEPKQEDDEEYSGRFVMRIPKELHRYLAKRATDNDISLNQYVQYLLTSSAVTDGFEKVMEGCVGRFNQLIEEMRSIEYKIEGATTGYDRRQELRLIYKTDYERAA